MRVLKTKTLGSNSGVEDQSNSGVEDQSNSGVEDQSKSLNRTDSENGHVHIPQWTGLTHPPGAHVPSPSGLCVRWLFCVVTSQAKSQEEVMVGP